MLRLSIIVPCYNVEAYLEKCLISLLQQDISKNDYEIVIINDGSTDGSLAIAEEYEKKNKNIKIISQTNKGLGAARNTGIKVSKGKSILFVDSDDFIKENVLEGLLNTLESDTLDILRFNYEGIDEKGNIISKKKNSTYSINWNEEITNGEVFLTEKLGWACYVWAFLFDSSFLKKNKIHFNEDIYFEDVEWLVNVLLKAQRVKCINKHVYFYLLRSGSITQSVDMIKKNKIISDKVYVANYLASISDSTDNEKVRRWCLASVALIFMSILSYVENNLPQRKGEMIKLLRQKYLPLKSYRFTLKQKRDLILINLSPKLYCYFKKS